MLIALDITLLFELIRHFIKELFFHCSMIFSIVTTLVLWCLSIDTDTQLILFEMCRFVLFLFQTSLIQMYEPTVNMYNINTIGNIIVWRHHSVKVLYHLFSFVMHWRAGYQEGRVGIPLTCLTPPHFLCLSQARDRFPTPYIFLCSMSWDERWLFVLLILVTITV